VREGEIEPGEEQGVLSQDEDVDACPVS